MPRILSLSAVGLALLITLAVVRPQAAGAGRATCLASTLSGDVQGLDLIDSCAFLGVPYAASPAGGNRWRPPQPAVPWAPVTLSAMTPPSPCPQVQLPAGTLTGIEDCLRLNIWVSDPFAAELAPVIVWLHTGAFFAAGANFAGTTGRRLAEEYGVVIVAPNYRLGPFGFLAHAALAIEDPAHPTSGNYGLLDQRAALAWVRDNIANFGGDPENVTVAGSSAGGQSVGLHLVSPASAGLFDGAIIQSAYPTSRWRSWDEGLAQGDAFAASLGCTDPAQVLSCLRSASRDQVLTALSQAAQQVVEPPNRVYWEPIVDGFEIPDQPRSLFEQGDYHHVPVLIGANRDEGWGAVITRSFPAGVTLAQYEAWVGNEFGDAAASILARYPASHFASPQEAMARVVGDGQFLCETRRLATLISHGGFPGQGPLANIGRGRRENVALFLYSYEYELDDLSLDHVIHGVESNILFGNNYSPPVFLVNHILTAADLALHAHMAAYWTEFAATGDPNADGAPEWPEYHRSREDHMVFDVNPAASTDPDHNVCAFWSHFFFRSMLGELPAATY